jgi:hypothetical protein
MGTKEVVALEIVEIETGKVVKTVDVSGKSARQIEMVEMGLLRHMNLEQYSVREKADP